MAVLCDIWFARPQGHLRHRRRRHRRGCHASRCA
uniref:Uncharacterized protein n=1 Tax=Setaria italica TaxID=4555 RepID=K3YF92_SETIT